MRKENLREIEREQISEKLGELSQRRRGRCAKVSNAADKLQPIGIFRATSTSKKEYHPSKYTRCYLLDHLHPNDRPEAHNLLI
jgi:hypothetical protein